MTEKQDIWHGLRIQVRQRLAKAVEHLHKTGSLRRSDIQRFGEVSIPQATADINEIKKRMPGLMEYDHSVKSYRLRPGYSGKYRAEHAA